MKKILASIVAIILLFITTISFAAISVPMYVTSETSVGNLVGEVVITKTKYGLLFMPNLHSLTPGIHGFHIHQNPSCAQNGMAAGGHFDPQNTGKHQGPYSENGHLGDLPALYVNADGSATLPVLAVRLTHLKIIRHHALIIHDGGDNYSDTPEKLGGGGSRMVCGIIK